MFIVVVPCRTRNNVQVSVLASAWAVVVRCSVIVLPWSSSPSAADMIAQPGRLLFTLGTQETVGMPHAGNLLYRR
jgi:hypothetical protein